MNIWMQIAIPLLVTSAALVTVAILRRYIKPEAVVVTVLALALGVGSLVGGIGADKNASRKKAGAMTATDNISLAIAEKYTLMGQYDLASRILEDLGVSCAEDDGVQLASADLAMLQEDFQSAAHLYELIGLEEEASEAREHSRGKLPGDGAIASYMSFKGFEPMDYGIKESAKADTEKISESVIQKVNGRMDTYRKSLGDRIMDAVDTASELSVSFKSLVQGEFYDTEAFEASVKALAEVVTTSAALKSNPYIREALVKGYVAKGDYDGFAAFAGEYSTPEELTVLAELFASGMVDRDAFSRSFATISKSKAKEMIEHCYSVLEKNRDGLTEERYERYRDRIAQFEKQTDDPVLFGLYSSLMANAAGDDHTVRSKSFMAMAKLAFFEGDRDLAEKYIEDALGTSADSDDENYRVPMQQLTGIIQGSSNSEEIKNVAEYVDKALDHSTSSDFTTDYMDSTYVPKPDVVPDGGDNDYPSGDNDYPSGDNDYPSGDDDYPSGDNDYPSGDNDYPSGDNDQNGDDSTDGEDTPAVGEIMDEFQDSFEDKVITATAMLNIGVIDKSDFPNIAARVQIQSQTWTSLEEIKENLIVYDCGSPITEFTIEKLEFKGARIVLLCDVSGSMSGNEQALKDAVKAFARNMTEGEKVSVVGFDDDIVFKSPFYSDPDMIADYADQKIATGGGTALYNSVVETLDDFISDINSNDIIIAMTDGQDGNRVGEADMKNTLGAKAADKGVTVYTMGLGYSVDTEYLTMMARHGNGSFLYAESMEKVETFYDFIHGQLANQYVLKYTAKNQTLNTRKLKIEMKDELGNAEKTYYLTEPEYGNTDSDSYDPYIATDSELTVYGFSEKFIYKSNKPQTLTLLGKSFDEGDDIYVTLTGAVQYKLTPAFADSGKYTVSIPAEISTGVYDLEVSVRGESFRLEGELTVAVHGTQKNFKFGDYHFTALSSSIDSNGNTVLSGNVIMNGWLRFKGDVVIKGAYNDAERVTVYDAYGCTVSYNTAIAQGIAKYMAEKGVPLSIGALGEFDIYDHAYNAMDYENFPVDTVVKNSELNSINVLFFFVENGSFSVYPDMIKFQGFSLHYDLPFQEQLIRNFKLGTTFKLNIDTEVLFGANQVAMMGEASYEDLRDEEMIFVSCPVNLSKLETKFDTLRNDYSLEFGVGFKSLGAVDGLEASIGFIGGRFDSIGLQMESDTLVLPLVATPVPVSMKDFGFELKGFSEFESDDSLLSKVLSTTVVAKFKVNVASLNDYIPAIAKLIDDEDVALATLDNCELSLCLKEFRLAFEADVVLATVLDVGKCEIELGKFDYTNALIGYYDKEQYGVRAKLTVGSKWETTNLMLDLTGSAELTLGYPYSGLWFNGGVDFDIGWWILRGGVDISGDALIGAYENSSGNFQFSIIVRGTDSGGKYDGFHLYITKASGFQINTY